MDISIFLAKLIGLYLVIVSVICLVRKKQVKATGKELACCKSTLAVTAEISLIFGLVIAIDHSIWELNWKGLITLLGYLMIIKGIIRFAFPSFVKNLATKMDKTYWVMSIVMLIIGIYLTYCGFAYSG